MMMKRSFGNDSLSVNLTGSSGRIESGCEELSPQITTMTPWARVISPKVTITFATSEADRTRLSAICVRTPRPAPITNDSTSAGTHPTPWLSRNE